MKNFVLDNSLKNLGKAVLWQYDRAVRLLSIMKHMQVLFFCAIEQFWAKWMERVLSIDTCGEFGCLVWSILLGVPRPTVTDGNGNVRQIVPSVYRRLLKGKYYLSKADASAESILGYLEIVFGIPGRDAYSDWQLTYCEYGWSTNIEELNDLHNNPPRLQYHVYRAYDAGEIFGYVKSIEDAEHGRYKIVSQNYVVQSAITAKENTSWEAIAAKVSETEEAADLTHEDEMLLLKLYDPSGICRKIAGAPSDALSISVDYTMGETSVYATIVRRRMCGVAVVDDGDMAMHYEKSPYFGMMHRDQQALFEQRMDDVCPYPLGIKSNEPVEEVVFGFIGQENEQYKTCREYSVGDVFGYADGEGEAFNWECIEPISAVENISFGAIKHKVKKTNKGYPFVGNLVECERPYQNAASLRWENLTLWDENSGSMEITEGKWPAVAAIFPTERFVPYTTSSGATITVLDSCSVYLPYNALFLGTYQGFSFGYKTDLLDVQNRPQTLPHEKYMQTDISDGKTFVAKDSIYGIQIITTKMPRMGHDYEFQIPENPFLAFGITDAVGYIAHSLNWQAYTKSQMELPISGVVYRPFATFGDNENAYYLSGERLPNTTIISNSTSMKLR